MISWSSKKQKTIVTSTCAAEYIALSEASRELIWVCSLLDELGYKPKEAPRLLCDNSAAVILSGDQVFHDRVKHLDIHYHWIREHVENGEIVVSQIATINNITNILTKALLEPAFMNLRKFLGMVGPCYS